MITRRSVNALVLGGTAPLVPDEEPRNSRVISYHLPADPEFACHVEGSSLLVKALNGRGQTLRVRVVGVRRSGFGEKFSEILD